MAQKTKISVKKILQALFTLVVATACITAMISASRIENNKTLTNVEVHIKSEKLYHFVEEKQILDEAIKNRNIDIQNTPIGKMDLQTMEHVLKTDPWVADAQLYIDNNRVLQILITQRVPVARIFDHTGSSYYIDNTLSTMPLSDNFKYYTSVVTNAPVIGTDSLGMWLKSQVVAMVENIRADTFWNAQISQIIIMPDYTFQLVPVLGQQKIIFGDTSRMKEKFNNIYAFYKKVLNRIGWDKYETLDVRYKGQVVAAPSLPYTGPDDKAVVELNMDWRNSIEQTEARKDSITAAAKAKIKPVVAAKPKQDSKKDAKSIQNSKDKNGKAVAKAISKDAGKGKKPDHAAPDGNKKKNETINKDNKKDTKRAAKYVYPEHNN